MFSKNKTSGQLRHSAFFELTMKDISIQFSNCIRLFLTFLYLTQVSVAGAAEDTYPLPFKSTDFAQGIYATGGNHGGEIGATVVKHPRDWNLRWQNADGDWVNQYESVVDNPHCDNNQTDCDTQGKHIIFRAPLYAPVDGKVVSCWRNHPNNIGANKEHRRCGNLLNNEGKPLACDSEDCPSDVVCRITRSGNYMAILTKDDHRLLYAHLSPGTIPETLCPFDNELMVNARLKDCADGVCSKFPEEAVIPKADRPFVRRGDFIGRAGTSGASSGPHTHIHQGPMEENASGILVKVGDHHPYLINNAWMRPSETPSWTKLDGWAMKRTVDNPLPLVKPSPFLRTDSLTTGLVKAVSLAGSVVSYINASDTLKLTSFDVDGAGKIQSQQIKTGIKINRLASAQSGNGRDVVTAARNENGDLRIDYWQVANNGAITHKDQKTAGAIKQLALTQFPTDKGVVVAIRAGNGNLKLISYATDTAGNLTRTGSIAGNSARTVSIARIKKGRHARESALNPFKGVATAIKTQAGKLRVQTWKWNQNSKTLTSANTQLGEAILGQVTIQAIPLADNRQMLVTAARTASGMLLQSWSVDSNGVLKNKWTKRLGDAHHITINAVSDGRFVTSLEDGQGDLLIKGWSLGDKGKIAAVGDVAAGKVSYVSSSMIKRNRGNTRLILTAIRDGMQKLRMIVYNSNM